MEQQEKVFADGMIAKRREGSPDFVISELSFKVDEFKAFLDKHSKNGWVNTTIKQAKSGKFYGELNTFEPKKKEVQGEMGD